MPLSSGSRLGPYEIVGSLGSGGMGEVYRARDPRLNRHIAIKVLPDLLAGDPVRLQRLQREAQVLASLNHPQIATIYGLEESNGIYALVMELVEGEDLKRRISRGPLPLEEVLPLAQQMAEGLEAAHGQGIIHRDLKPANVMVRADGTLKVLDFGLAKGMDSGSLASAARPNESPTMTQQGAMTASGMILGTAAYMSPEQARGRDVDKRADVWAFGCVLFEMLAGRSAFPGETVSDTMASVLQREPDWRALPSETPSGIQRLLRRCLEKDPKRRLHDIADARIEIEEARSGGRPDGPFAPVRSRSRLAWQSSLALVALAAAGGAGWFLRPVPTPSELRLELNTPPTTDTTLAISPDGLKVAFVAGSGGKRQLWVRSLDSLMPRPLPGTDNASRPFWSPDGRSLGFFADVKLKRINVDDGSSQTLATNAGVPLGGAWNTDGTILFADNPGGPIFRTSVQGGERIAVTNVDRPRQRGHYFPQFLPDGQHFLFFVGGNPEARGVYVGQLDRLDSKRLFDAAGPAAYAVTGHLIFVRDNKLLAQRFDPARVDLKGDAFVVNERVGARTVLSTSAAGPIAYRMPPEDVGKRQLVWIDRSGRELDKVVYPDTAALGPALSHDGRRVAVFRFESGNMDIWSYETTRRVWDRITFDPGDDIGPLWSPDDNSILFASARKTGALNLYRKRLSGPPGSEEVLLATPVGEFPMDLSADGRFLLYATLTPTHGTDLWVLPLGGERQPLAVVQTEFNETMGQFSPDGNWIAYESDKTGRYEIYLRPFPGPGSDLLVSTDGGTQVRWNPNGKELFYVAADDRLMAVPIHMLPDKKNVALRTPSGLFKTNVGSSATLRYRQQYMVSRDGQSFVMNSVVDEGVASPITVILNWKPIR
jgi:eukaryotic-like serine/threonine-protein kinase